MEAASLGQQWVAPRVTEVPHTERGTSEVSSEWLLNAQTDVPVLTCSGELVRTPVQAAVG